MYVRGIRGAITVEQNTSVDILDGAKTLLLALIEKNHLLVDDVASVFFSVTQDLNAEFPAVAARELGWTSTPLFCMNEIPVPNSLPRCIRVLLHVNSPLAQASMHHIYLRDAKALRPDQQGA
jgi:chorismate mutase